jgi:predicted transcriptional regulator
VSKTFLSPSPFHVKEQIHHSINKSIGRRDKKNNTDIIFIYKILYFMHVSGKCYSRAYLATKSGAGNGKTPRLLDQLIDAGLLSIQFDRYDNRKIEYYEITESGKQIFLNLEMILGTLKTDIIPESKKEKILNAATSIYR